MPKHRGAKRVDPIVEAAPVSGHCAVCGLSDARALVLVELAGGERATLCGSHSLMHRRAGAMARTIHELQRSLADRRETDRRGTGEVDELAEALTAAFTRERRGADRRLS
ncbi:MAG: hypothetical protein JST00_30960 [Deltaproteobacteria bacterium]|nr:hypothetical protein [Deltaproteobacteria bacterium]